MRNNQLNLRNVVAIAIFFVGFTVFSGCESKQDIVDNNALIGKWVRSHSLIEGRVIVFTEDYRVEQYLDHIYRNTTIPVYYPFSFYVTYSISGNRITFTVHRFYPTAYSFSETYGFSLRGNSLTIEAFSNPFSGTFEGRHSVSFTRVQ